MCVCVCVCVCACVCVCERERERVGCFGFLLNGISTFRGYLMQNPSSYKNNKNEKIRRMHIVPK